MSTMFKWIVAATLGAATWAQAEVKPVAYYRLGESDDKAQAGAVVAKSVDEFKGTPLVRMAQATATYEAVSDSTAVSATQSTLAVKFDGKEYLLRKGIAVAGNDNFGIEAFVKADTEKGFAYVVCWGAGSHGFSLIRNDKGYQALLGGIQLIGWSGDQPIGKWVHVAIVRADGRTTFYFNGQPMGDTSAKPNLAGTGDGLAIGATGDGKEGFLKGSVDEVRVFTFEKGKFSPNDLLLNRKPGK